jgi:hypothetical protein
MKTESLNRSLLAVSTWTRCSWPARRHIWYLTSGSLCPSCSGVDICVLNWPSNKQNKTPRLECASNLHRLIDRRLLVKLVPTFADRGCRVVSETDPHGRILGFADPSRYFFFQVTPQVYSRVWVDPVPDPLLLRKSGSAGNRTRTSGSVARNCDHHMQQWFLHLHFNIYLFYIFTFYVFTLSFFTSRFYIFAILRSLHSLSTFRFYISQHFSDWSLRRKCL